MHSSLDSGDGIGYVPYISNEDTYRHHFTSHASYDPSSFHLIGDARSAPMVGEGKEKACVKLISPSEGAVARAKEELSRERKEESKAKRLQLCVGKGRSRSACGKLRGKVQKSKGGRSKKSKKASPKGKAKSRAKKVGKVKRLGKKKSGKAKTRK